MPNVPIAFNQAGQCFYKNTSINISDNIAEWIAIYPRSRGNFRILPLMLAVILGCGVCDPLVLLLAGEICWQKTVLIVNEASLTKNDENSYLFY